MEIIEKSCLVGSIELTFSVRGDLGRVILTHSVRTASIRLFRRLLRGLTDAFVGRPTALAIRGTIAGSGT